MAGGGGWTVLVADHFVPGVQRGGRVALREGVVEATKWTVVKRKLQFACCTAAKRRRLRYPLWGSYYLRWWIVDQFLLVCGRGLFTYNSTTLILYLRLMGAKIGAYCNIDPGTNFGEFDLIDIGEGCAFDAARVRPFTMEGGCMVLGKIVIGKSCRAECGRLLRPEASAGHDSVVNIKTIIAPGANVPPNTVFPPKSSSHEIADANSDYVTLCRTTLPGPSVLTKLFLGYPLLGFVKIVSLLPWLGCVYLLSRAGNFNGDSSSAFGQAVTYFAGTSRIVWKVLALVVVETVCPFFQLAAAIFVKRCVLGLAKPGLPISGQWPLLRRWVGSKLFADGTLCHTYGLIGKHYEYTSMIYRALGAKIGKRIYWPGTGLFTFEHEFLEVSDDVVFGSRTFVVATDALGSARISIGAGSMIADRCVLLPGSSIGRNTVMGSGGLARRDAAYPDGSVWIGSKAGGATLWDLGDPVAAATADTILPFGRAFYNRQANYWVIPMWLCAMYSIAIKGFAVVIKASPIVVAIQLGAVVFRNEHDLTNTDETLPLDGTDSQIVLLIAYSVMIGSCIVTHLFISTFCIWSEIWAKWALFGRRMPGSYNWDESSYNQRWQIYIALQTIRGDFIEHLRGTWFLVLFFRALGANIGDRVCLYPTGGDPMMTEPDLVTIGDEACIDQASVVCHLNSKGQFSLNPLEIGEGAVLRSGSRLLSGATMEDDTVLLEHTIILSGDLAHAGSAWQGWPADEVLPTKGKSEFDKQSIARRTSMNARSRGSGSRPARRWARRARQKFYGVFATRKQEEN
ncbi:hypothetical protein BDK51DRAFT_31135 [Blyttiomyces helicus]|uniref:Trimeric LpxA-like protein n=1 Tax=Blyttiomyces helicus TaxID=388810 RepID=A0A4P9WHJ8_9FUNG|nr:hypothetical protein BDK51DRAFT_31135 [Blyttiomyces helicus]|eukprot:RKO90570.1 hypothetical protein BDK51DRAFT_31135 [Blyttiomyces helicus]